MPLADTGQAIGKVSELLVQHLTTETGLDISIGRPEPSSNGSTTTGARLNLFLYEALFDPSLKNVILDEGQPAPLWLVLKYLITPFDDTGHSDTIEAQEHLGEGLRALQKLSFLPLNGATLPADVVAALDANPEVMKVTFDEANSDLLSRIMQGADEKYRFSMSFQVRPVMIAAGDMPSYAFLVGVDNTTAPATIIGEAGIQMPVLPSMGPLLTSVTPQAFEANDEITVYGDNLNATDVSIQLDGVDLTIVTQSSNIITCTVNGPISGGTELSAGSLGICALETLETGRTRRSNLIVGNLRPTVMTGAASAVSAVVTPPPDMPPAPPPVAGTITLSGTLLGTEDDDVFLALYRDGTVVRNFDTAFTFAADQSTLTLVMPDDQAVTPGVYNVILRVNGQQARMSPAVTL